MPSSLRVTVAWYRSGSLVSTIVVDTAELVFAELTLVFIVFVFTLELARLTFVPTGCAPQPSIPAAPTTNPVDIITL
jgi:hypothetical protein